MKSKADQYVEDWKNFTERKEPETLLFSAGQTHAHVCAYGDIAVHNIGHIQKEHALDLAQWIIDTYSVPEEPKPVQEEPEPDWSIPVVGKAYKNRMGDKIIVAYVREHKVIGIRCRDEYLLSYYRFPFHYSDGTHDYDIVGFWEEPK